MERRLELLKNSPSRAIVGIETGGAEGRIGAVLVEVSGNGDRTVLDLHAFQSMELPAELMTALAEVAGEARADSHEYADANFLVLHHINTLFYGLLEEAGVDVGQIDLIGLKRMEIEGRDFPEDPGALSETTGCVVASCFRIGPEKGAGSWLPVKEAILRGLVDEMVAKYDLDDEVREAVAIALLANESVYHESLDEGCPAGNGSPAGGAAKRRTVRGPAGRDESSALYGEFYFPSG